MKHPFEGLWLIHYYFGLTPWLTISDLPEDAALEINRLTGKTAGLCPDTGRERYYQVRLEVEEWDRRQHLARGGAVEHVNPVYAMLSETELASRAVRGGNAVAIPADMIPADLMSVSVGDSFPNFFAFRRRESGLLGTTFSPAEFMQLFSGTRYQRNGLRDTMARRGFASRSASTRARHWLRSALRPAR